jgi:amino acid permease
MASSIFSLSKSIVGMGVLALPAGLAYINPNPSAVSVATAGALVVLFGLMGAYSFSLIGELCEEHQCSTFTELWSKTVSASSAKLIPAVITSMCLLTPLVYSIMIGEKTTVL